MADIEKDPSQLNWAVRDLEEFATLPWSGSDAFVAADVLSRTRDASKFLAHAITGGDLILGAPVMEALRLTQPGTQQTTESYAARIEQLRAEQQERIDTLEAENADLTTERNAFREAFTIFDGVVLNAAGKLAEVEVIGDVDFPLGDIEDSLRTADEEAGNKVSGYIE